MIAWYGTFPSGTIVGLMGLEYVRDPDLLRHGIGPSLPAHLETQIQSRSHAVHRIFLGTYARNYMARGLLEKAGYQLSAGPEAGLQTYYVVPENRPRSSVTYEKLMYDSTLFPRRRPFSSEPLH